MPDEDVIPSVDKGGVGRNPTHRKIRYSKIFLFEKSGNILLFRNRTYKVSISVGLMANKMHPVNTVFGTDGGPHLIRENVFKTELLNAIQAENRPALKTATSQKINAVETIMLQSKWETLE